MYQQMIHGFLGLRVTALLKNYNNKIKENTSKRNVLKWNDINEFYSLHQHNRWLHFREGDAKQGVGYAAGYTKVYISFYSLTHEMQDVTSGFWFHSNHVKGCGLWMCVHVSMCVRTRVSGIWSMEQENILFLFTGLHPYYRSQRSEIYKLGEHTAFLTHTLKQTHTA